MGVALALIAMLTACTPATTPETDDVVAAEAQTQPAELVDLTIYYRHGSGEKAYLVPLIREVPVTSQLPRTALALLLEGPPEDAAEGVQAAVPASTQIREFTMKDGVAAVDVSSEIVDDARSVGRRPEHEVLALAAIANTLTEFPEITRVHMSIEGESDGPFWGAWGLPQYLVRDESVVEPSRAGSAVPSLDGFSKRRQQIGVEQRPRPAIPVVRISPRVGYLRVTVEVTAADGGALVGPVPPSRARRVGDDIVLTVEGAAAVPLTGDQMGTFDDPAFSAARVDVADDPARVEVTITPVKRAAFWLHTSHDPARVVLDVRR